MSVNPIAIYSENLVVYWSGLIIALGIASGFLLSLSIYSAQNRRASSMWVFLPFAILFSLFLCRMLHWYCHEEQYSSWYSALTDLSGGSYCIQGALLGVYLGAVVSRGLGMTDNIGKLLDAVAPGFALTISFIRLSSLFNNSCHSKYSVTNKMFQRLPIAINSGENSDYRFATFFIEFILMLMACMILIGLYYKYHNAKMKKPCKRDGHIYRLFLVMFSVVELVMDSTRNDSSFFHLHGGLVKINKFLGFISIGQLTAAIIILLIMIYYTKKSIQANGRKGYHFVLEFGFFLSLAAVGGLEYCVQRWTNMYRMIYVGMSLAAVLMGVIVFLMYKSCIYRRYEMENEY